MVGLTATDTCEASAGPKMGADGSPGGDMDRCRCGDADRMTLPEAETR